MKKILLFFVVSLLLNKVQAQVIWNHGEGSSCVGYHYCKVVTPDDFTTEYPIYRFKDTSLFRFYSHDFIIESLRGTTSIGTPNSIDIVFANDTGLVKKFTLDSDILDGIYGYTPAPSISYYNASGIVSAPTKKIAFVATPSTGDGYSIDISGAGFSSIYSVSVTPIKNTSTATSVPKVSIKTYTTSAVVVNIIEGNANTVNLLGSLVSLGVTESFANTTGLTLMVTVEGN